MLLIRNTLLLLLLCICSNVFAQTSNIDTTRIKRIKIYPFPAIGYAPETHWYFGGVVLLNMRFSDDSLLQTNTVETEFNYTQNKQLIITAGFDLQFLKSKLRWIGENGFYKFPENYWGVGNETKESDKLSYDARRQELDNSLLLKFKNNFYLGIRQRYHQIELMETVTDSDLPDSNDPVRASGIGPRFLIDSRDNVLNATKGSYFSLQYQWFFPQLGGDGRFTKGEMDVRYYKKIHSKGIMAFQIVWGLATGNVPFRMLSLLGSESIMRGYYQGRYRDERIGAIQGEYRFAVWNWVGASVFGGAGNVGRSRKISTLLHPTYGAGLRIRIDKKENVNLRFDYARGDHSDGFYVSFGEAF